MTNQEWRHCTSTRRRSLGSLSLVGSARAKGHAQKIKCVKGTGLAAPYWLNLLPSLRSFSRLGGGLSRPPWRSGFQQRSAHETQGLDRHGVSVCEFRINKLAITSQYQSASSHRANYQPERIPITIWRTCAPCRSPCPPPGARAEAPVARAYRTDVHADWIHPLFGPSGGASSARMHTQRAFSAVKAPEWPLEANGQNK